MFDVHSIVESGGLLAVALIIFAESGILLGFFLPGDTLLLTAGLFAGQGKLSLFWLLTLTTVAAIVGYQVGYKFGERAGPRLFHRKNGILFREDYIQRTAHFFEKYGPVTVVAARFIAHVRTFVSVVAGASRMNRGRYLLFNIIGAILWVNSLILLGYWLGSTIPNIDKIILPVILGVLLIVYVVASWGILKSPNRRRHIKQGLKEDLRYMLGRDKK